MDAREYLMERFKIEFPATPHQVLGQNIPMNEVMQWMDDFAKKTNGNGWMGFFDPMPEEGEFILVYQVNTIDHPQTMIFGKSYLNHPNIKNCRWAKIPKTEETRNELNPGQLSYGGLSADVWQTSDKPFSDYPIGTKAQALGGGYWIKNERGWKWCTGATFPTPGGDWNGMVSLPAE